VTKRIDNILRAVCAEPWAIIHGKLEAILEFLALRADGVVFSAEEIASRVGEGQRTPAKANGVAVIPIYGIISHRTVMNMSGPGTTSTLAIGRALDEALGNPDVGGILFDVDSPGGTTSGVMEVAQKIFDARGQKPMIAIANAMMASAAYFIGSAADEVVVTPSGHSGSIGVYTVHVDQSKMNEQLGIKPTIVSAGKFKVEGNTTEPLSDEARGALQQLVDDAYAQFVNAVAKHRGATPSEVRDGFGEGRVLSADRSVEARLADRVATFDETLARLANPRRAASVGKNRATAARRLSLLEQQ